MIDEETYISNERISNQIKNFKDTIKTVDEARIEVPKYPPLAKLLELRPRGLLNKELLALFDLFPKKFQVKEKLTFDKAQNLPISERYIRDGAIIWTDDQDEVSLL